ncbi:MAG: hypothetical protein ABEI99_00595 [Halobaculum sp.]
MVPSTRRAVLHGAAGLAAALSGCGERTSESGRTTPTEAATAAAGAYSGSQSVDDVTVRMLRAETDRPPVWVADSAGEGTGRPTPRSDERFLESTMLSTPTEASQVAVAGVEKSRVTPFVENTDFDSQSVYLETIRVRDCVRLVLCDIAWSADSISTAYADRIRPYDERCSATAWAYEVRLIRIPAVFPPGEPSQHSTRVGGECPERPSETQTGGEN